jgi:hypothetical protein
MAILDSRIHIIALIERHGDGLVERGSEQGLGLEEHGVAALFQGLDRLLHRHRRNHCYRNFRGMGNWVRHQNGSFQRLDNGGFR